MIALGALIPLVILVGLVAGIAALAKRNDQEPQDGFARRLVVSALTFGLTIVAAVGVFMLIDVAIGSIGGFARSGSGDLALALAFTIIGIPAAFLLWRYEMKALAGSDGRSVVWLLHAALASAVFSIGTVIALGHGLRFDEFDSEARSALVFGLTWLAVWVFHEWVNRRRPAPLLSSLPHAVGAATGLVTAAFGGVSLIDALIGETVGEDVIAATGPLDAVIAAVIWTVVGLGVWTWQFLRQSDSDGLSRAGLVLGLGVGGGALMGLGGLTALLTFLLTAITDTLDTDALGGAVGSAAIGFLLWRFHSGMVGDERGRRIERHLLSGLSLIGLAVGVGVLVNAGLAAVTPAFASTNEDELLWGGLAALVVNVPVWWLTWRPDRTPDPDGGTTVQRTYLTVLGGAAGVTGAIALIVFVFQLLEGLLEGDSLSGIVDGVRAPLGFVIATGLVTAYHYRRWAASREHSPAPEPITLERLTFVGSAEVARSLREGLGVRVSEWRSAGEGRVLSPDELAAHIKTLDATDALVVEEDRGYRVVRLLRPTDHRPHTGEPQE